MNSLLNKENYVFNNRKDDISIILIEPSKTQNVGSIARIMMNFGFNNLILINPQVNLADPEIEIVARKAIGIVKHAQLITTTLLDIRSNFQMLIGTTARIGSDYNLNRVAISPNTAFSEEMPHGKIGIVFGREQHGLTNEEVVLCDLVLSIPTHSEYPVLNLSHALGIILYDLSTKLDSMEQNQDKKRPKHRVATFKERKQLETYFNDLVENCKYHPEKKHIATQSFSNIMSRGYVTGREVTTLMGVFKWISYQFEKSS
ncbi:MAG: RNA methyltransferase [Candidatus Hodarchaeales archaeon]